MINGLKFKVDMFEFTPLCVALLAFTQADIERDLYMKLPAGFIIPGRTLTDEDRKNYVLKLDKSRQGEYGTYISRKTFSR